MTKFDQICELVAIPALILISTRNATIIRLTTILILTAMLGLTVYQCGDRVAYFFSRPLFVDINEFDAKQATFPAIVICPAGQFRSSTPNDVFSNNYVLIPRDYYYTEQHKEQVAQALQHSTTFRMSDIDGLANELQTIIDSVNWYNSNNATSGNFKQTSLNRIEQIGIVLQPYFPHIAQLVQINEPYPGRDISLDRNASAEWSIYRYRNVTTQYDYCVQSLGSWDTFNVLWCRLLGMTDFHSPDVVTELQNFDENKIQYQQFVDAARPTLEDTILHCEWMNGECNISELWTPQGLCFSVGPSINESSIVTETGSKSSVTLLINALVYDFPTDEPMIYYHPTSAIEAAMEGNGVNVQVGMASSIAISEIRNNILFDSLCGSKQLHDFATYSQKKCIWQETSDEIANTCKCNFFDSSNLHKNESQSIAMENITSCTLDQELTCVVNLDVSKAGGDCRSDCTQSSIDVDLSTSTLNLRLIRSLLPDDWSQRSTLDVQNAMNAAGQRAEQLPDEDELNELMDQFFRFHLTMVRIFWWKNGSDPYYPAWLQVGDYGTYFDHRAPPIIPCNFSTLNVSTLDLPRDREMVILEAMNEVVAKYRASKVNWSSNYIEEAYYPFLNALNATSQSLAAKNDWKDKLKGAAYALILNDFSAYKNCLTSPNNANKTFIGEPDLLHYCFSLQCYVRDPGFGTTTITELRQNFNTNVSYANYWDLNALAPLVKDLFWFNSTVYQPPQSATLLLNDKIAAVFNNTAGNSLWDAPIMIYKSWLVKELALSSGNWQSPLVSSEIATRGGTFDVFSASQGYSTGMSTRDDLQKMLVAVSKALTQLSSSDVTNSLVTVSNAFNSGFYKGGRFQQLLFGNSSGLEKLTNTAACADQLFQDVQSILNDYQAVQVADFATESTWFSNFIDLIDNELYIYTAGRGYDEANLAQVSIFFRSFRFRNSEQTLAYNTWALLSDIGGTLGLWLGATVLTFYELAMYCCAGSKTHHHRHHHQGKVDSNREERKNPEEIDSEMTLRRSSHATMSVSVSGGARGGNVGGNPP